MIKLALTNPYPPFIKTFPLLKQEVPTSSLMYSWADEEPAIKKMAKKQKD
jgi:hypothetical protein